MTGAWFVTATGTEVGKTHLTCTLLRHWRARGLSARGLKPVISGYSKEDTDTDTHHILDAMGTAATDQAIDAVSPFRFTAPLSPDMAAAREGRTIDFGKLVAYCEAVIETAPQRLLIEGVGGAFVPLTPNHTVADWIAALGLPAIVVTGSYLGALSHTLATVQALAARDIGLAAVIVSQSPDQPVPLSETAATLARFIKEAPILPLPRTGPEDARIEAFLEAFESVGNHVWDRHSRR